jgi:hypothetical protein
MVILGDIAHQPTSGGQDLVCFAEMRAVDLCPPAVQEPAHEGLWRLLRCAQ